MHWIGKDFLLKAIRPDGSTVTLIRIDQWNFNWQGTYDFATPVALPKGTRIDMVAHFDNSADEPRQPELAAEGRPLGRADDRRDVHRVPPVDARRRAPAQPAPEAGSAAAAPGGGGERIGGRARR